MKNKLLSNKKLIKMLAEQQEHLDKCARQNSLFFLKHEELKQTVKEINEAIDIMDDYLTNHEPGFWMRYTKYIVDNGLRDKARLREDKFDVGEAK